MHIYKRAFTNKYTWLEKVILNENTRNLDSTRGTFISSRKNWYQTWSLLTIKIQDWACIHIPGIRNHLLTLSKHCLVSRVILKDIVKLVRNKQKMLKPFFFFYNKLKTIKWPTRVHKKARNQHNPWLSINRW